MNFSELQNNGNGKSFKERSKIFGAGFGMMFLIFLLLPLTQLITESRPDRQLLDLRDQASPPPPPPPPEPPPPEEEEPEQEEPELEQEQEPLTLSQLEMALEPGMGGAGYGDFTLDLTGMAQSDLDRIFDLADVDRIPMSIYQVEPVYPFGMRRARIEGEVVIQFVVNTDGRVVNPRVVRSTRSEFERPAVEAVTQWRFEPGVRQGQRVNVRMEVPIRFSIDR